MSRFRPIACAFALGLAPLLKCSHSLLEVFPFTIGSVPIHYWKCSHSLLEVFSFTVECDWETIENSRGVVQKEQGFNPPLE